MPTSSQKMFGTLLRLKYYKIEMIHIYFTKQLHKKMNSPSKNSSTHCVWFPGDIKQIDTNIVNQCFNNSEKGLLIKYQRMPSRK